MHFDAVCRDGRRAVFEKRPLARLPQGHAVVAAKPDVARVIALVIRADREDRSDLVATVGEGHAGLCPHHVMLHVEVATVELHAVCAATLERRLAVVVLLALEHALHADDGLAFAQTGNRDVGIIG